MNPLLLALIPQMFAWLTKLIAEARADSKTPAEKQVQLEKLSSDLAALEPAVAAVVLPDKH